MRTVCTIVVGWQAFEGAPIVVAANRDERLARESTPPAVREDDVDYLAPRDEEAGGTWMGVNEHRVFAGLTNRWVDADLHAERSRGLLLNDVLGKATDASEAIAIVQAAVDANDYEGFNVVVADPEEAHLLEYDGTRTSRRLDPGVHVLINTGADGSYTIPDSSSEIAKRQAENADRVREVLSPKLDETADEWLERGKGILGDHEYGVCVHGDGYGTISTSLIAVWEDGTIDYAYADGPPCETDTRHVDGHI